MHVAFASFSLLLNFALSGLILSIVLSLSLFLLFFVFSLHSLNAAFTELQTDLADLVQISDKNLPYRDFRTFAMRFLFPKAGDHHPVLCPLVMNDSKLEQADAIRHLESFRELILDKKFLLVFIRTLEAQGSFSLQDKCNVASLLMVSFQNDLDYATEWVFYL